MRARRSCSQTDVRSAPKRRFAPMQNISSPADSVVDETSREKVLQQLPKLGLQIGLAARMRAIEREREGVPDRGRLAHLLRRRQLFAADDQHAHRVLHLRERDEHGRQRAEILVRAADEAARYRRRTAVFRPGTAPRESFRPARDRAAGDRRRRQRWPAGCRRCGRTEKGWSSAPRRRTRHGDGAPGAGRSAGPWP